MTICRNLHHLMMAGVSQADWRYVSGYHLKVRKATGAEYQRLSPYEMTICRNFYHLISNNYGAEFPQNDW